MKLRKEFELLLKKVGRLETQVRQITCEHDFTFIGYFADKKEIGIYLKCSKCGLEKKKISVQIKQ